MHDSIRSPQKDLLAVYTFRRFRTCVDVLNQSVNHLTMAQGVLMGILSLTLWFLLCGLSSCTVPRENLGKNSSVNETDRNAASAAASFFLGNDTPTPVTSTPLTPPSGGSGTTWCVAKNNVDDKTLQVALDYACGLGGADCTKIQQGGACFEPDNVQSHASFAFNNYYIKNGMLPGTCDFGGNAAPTALNPSHGNCLYDTSSTTSGINGSGTLPGSGGSIPQPTSSNSSGAIVTLLIPFLLVTVSLAVASLQ